MPEKACAAGCRELDHREVGPGPGSVGPAHRLLAGVDPIDAVVVQLLVMNLILGTVAVSVVTVVAVVTRAAVTPRSTLAPWTRFDAG